MLFGVLASGTLWHAGYHGASSRPCKHSCLNASLVIKQGESQLLRLLYALQSRGLTHSASTAASSGLCGLLSLRCSFWCTQAFVHKMQPPVQAAYFVGLLGLPNKRGALILPCLPQKYALPGAVFSAASVMDSSWVKCKLHVRLNNLALSCAYQEFGTLFISMFLHTIVARHGT